MKGTVQAPMKQMLARGRRALKSAVVSPSGAAGAMAMPSDVGGGVYGLPPSTAFFSAAGVADATSWGPTVTEQHRRGHQGYKRFTLDFVHMHPMGRDHKHVLHDAFETNILAGNTSGLPFMRAPGARGDEGVRGAAAPHDGSLWTARAHQLHVGGGAIPTESSASGSNGSATMTRSRSATTRSRSRSQPGWSSSVRPDRWKVVDGKMEKGIDPGVAVVGGGASLVGEIDEGGKLLAEAKELYNLQLVGELAASAHTCYLLQEEQQRRRDEVEARLRILRNEQMDMLALREERVARETSSPIKRFADRRRATIPVHMRPEWRANRTGVPPNAYCPMKPHRTYRDDGPIQIKPQRYGMLNGAT